MFDIKQYPEIILHVKQISKICKPNTSGWYECFCPYCDDSTRKNNPNSGHFHLSPTFPFAHCFRCGTKVSLDKYLIDTGFKNIDILMELKKFPIFTYSPHSSIIKYISEINIRQNISTHYTEFINTNHIQFKNFQKYIYSRCLDINPIDYLLLPKFIKNILQIHFFNNSGELSMTRNISHTKSRYISNGKYYFFQDISDIDKFESIVITEGAFDLINLHKYSPIFKNNFFISIGGINYQTLITDIISNFLLIGTYIINVIFDKNVFNINRRIKTILYRSNILNPNIKLNFYIPVIGKDVSDFIIVKKLEINN
jgi:hypothetical protein